MQEKQNSLTVLINPSSLGKQKLYGRIYLISICQILTQKKGKGRRNRPEEDRQLLKTFGNCLLLVYFFFFLSFFCVSISYTPPPPPLPKHHHKDSCQNIGGNCFSCMQTCLTQPVFLVLHHFKTSFWFVGLCVPVPTNKQTKTEHNHLPEFHELYRCVNTNQSSPSQS